MRKIVTRCILKDGSAFGLAGFIVFAILLTTSNFFAPDIVPFTELDEVEGELIKFSVGVRAGSYISYGVKKDDGTVVKVTGVKNIGPKLIEALKNAIGSPVVIHYQNDPSVFFSRGFNLRSLRNLEVNGETVIDYSGMAANMRSARSKGARWYLIGIFLFMIIGAAWLLRKICKSLLSEKTLETH